MCNESVMSDADLPLWVKCQYYLVCYSVLIVVLNCIKSEQEDGHTNRNISFVLHTVKLKVVVLPIRFTMFR